MGSAKPEEEAVETVVPKQANGTFDATTGNNNVPTFHTVSWWRQLKWATWKNGILLQRYPVILLSLVLSSVFAVILSWVVGGRPIDEEDAVYPPAGAFDDCGAVKNSWLDALDYADRDKVQITLNESWRNGFGVSMMGLGGLCNAILVFNLIQGEINSKLLGVLRALGLRDSVYWVSWYLPLFVLSIINALLGAITAAFLPGHVYESVYFGGVFSSLICLQLALVSASFFLAAVCGTRRKACANFSILILIMAAFIPVIFSSATSWLPYASSPNGFKSDPVGLFWQHQSTTAYTCNIPIMNEFQGTWFKTDAERELVTDDEMFVGCYVASSWGLRVWKRNSITDRLFMFFFPYFHFYDIWGSFVGYTAKPNRKFSSAQASMSPEKLALDALPQLPSDDNGLVTTMAPQGSTFVTATPSWQDRDYNKNACPMRDHPDANLCRYLNDCGYAENPGAQYGSPSTRTSNGYLLLLSAMYILLTAYWAQVFCAGNGRGEKFYFFLLPSYWCGSRGKDESDEEHTNEHGAVGVTITNVKKQFGDFEAITDVSFKMNIGEVTALLGHNGAGKSTLSNVICCELFPTAGDVRVFGKSVMQDSFAVRGMVGLCKQDDFLWPVLSAKEHLELFAGLRGVADDRIPAVVQEWLESVDLQGVQLEFSSAYSGGMKRRLSVALATIGDRPLIVLDEPTTGMDPVSRRFVWRHIDAIKEGRVILLTTHAMEEADLLADEVVIMRKGGVAASGSPLALKAEHGTALQFSLLVEKEDLDGAMVYIEEFFAESKKYVTVEPFDAGNIVVKISALTDDQGGRGIKVKQLASFVSWLDNSESPVTEYGFSNSSLEEVFLKVTEGDEEEPTGNEDELEEQEEENVEADLEASAALNKLGSYVPKLSSWNQTFVIFADFWIRSWTGRPSISNWCIYGMFIIGVFLLGMGVAWYSPTPWLVLVNILVGLLLVTVISPIYADRSEGQFYLMQSQGLLPIGYIAGTSLYSLSCFFGYTLLCLTALFASPFFRTSQICSDSCWDNTLFGSREIANPTELFFFSDTYQGEEVRLEAYRAPGGYGFIIGTVIAIAIASVGNVLATAFFPGYRIPLVLIMFTTLIVGALPLLPVFLPKDDETYEECMKILNPDSICNQTFSAANADEDFAHCAGVSVNSETETYFCTPAYAALLSQFGFFQMLSMAYMNKVTFTSEPAGYVENVLIPAMEKSVKCKGDTCVFPLTTRLYGLNFLYTLIGAVILIIIGVCMAYVFVFPTALVLELKQSIARVFGICSFSKPIEKTEKEKQEEAKERVEVKEERETVEEIIKPILHDDNDTNSIFPKIDREAIPRDDICPVIMYKLRKVYPALGRRAPKVAVDSLDLHVPKGQVLGLLGKNGAGKTTALKVLVGAHASSGGIGLVSGYDCDMERIQVFERLGNCAQFDVIWENRSVQRHLEFFAAMKGLPKKEIKQAAKAIADAVGLGSDLVYARNAGALSGGMRRRLSIGMSLIGSPSVVILDEPTTGLDPSTRSYIWALINSFGTHDRSMIITTHMMIEADTLCNRIAIVARGKLVVVGTQQHLKNKFGEGYVLQLNLIHSTIECQEKAMDFVRCKLHPDAKLGIRQAKTLHVNLPRDINLEKVFTALYSKERTDEGGINQFLLSQSSLEDVFISLGD